MAHISGTDDMSDPIERHLDQLTVRLSSSFWTVLMTGHVWNG
jgi:hypothetical protein